MNDLTPTPLPAAIRIIYYTRDIRILDGDGRAPYCAICGAERVSVVEVDDMQPHEPSETDGGKGPLRFPPGAIFVLKRTEGDCSRIVHGVFCSRCVSYPAQPRHEDILVN